MTEELDYRKLFDEAPCGYVLLSADGVILKTNDWVANLLGYPTGEIDGKRLRDIFSMSARILFETNLAPLLKLQKNIREVTLDLKRSDGTLVPVIMGATSFPDPLGNANTIRIVFLEAGERRLYERELVSARDNAQKGLQKEMDDGQLREQFVAVLGHDLRNPLSSISAAARILSKETLSDRGRQVIGLMQGSVLRMSGLIDNVLDFARARLGGGIGLQLRVEDTLEPLINQVVQELRASSPDHDVLMSYTATRPVECDTSKIGQLVSNLVGNALSHGDKRQPIRIGAETTENGSFRLWVANGGKPIAAEAMPTLFNPFVRGQSQGYKDGLGLGLYIAHEIAKAHGGTLTATSTEQETCFLFEMPNTVG
ncbi:PAS domain-containing sensor histidine kinase [Rhizobium sp. XQZ8]|uniref:PAS domain-containing sensor histidine kinase n=1 Tax=Rhizobium populisoli TaxID=2859785 RepID=UPI001C686164|nr:PAS domain-containing sensor histidine kinase [Rhizobium populisoli]MBW6420646.1 PAS domain-containing sensor histidine kinase [Rhizobium populisoli]